MTASPGDISTRTPSGTAETRVARVPVRTATPSAASCRSTTAAASASSRARTWPASITVTAAPRRRNACAISSPTDPAPSTTRCRGSTAKSNSVSLVRNGTPPRPRISGTAGREPAAITTRGARSVRFPALTSWRPVKRASPSMTSPPQARNRSGESCGAMAPCTWARTPA